MMEGMGGKRGGVYGDENTARPRVDDLRMGQPRPDALQASDKYGDQFNEEAGTTGLEWTTHIWQKKGDA